MTGRASGRAAPIGSPLPGSRTSSFPALSTLMVLPSYTRPEGRRRTGVLAEIMTLSAGFATVILDHNREVSVEARKVQADPCPDACRPACRDCLQAGIEA